MSSNRVVFNLDEIYFVRGKRCLGECGKTIVLGLLKCGSNVYTEVVPDFKFNSRADDLYAKMLKVIRSNPLF